ncbi:nuclear GTPase SLIP-GC-like isoform X1 [Brachyhypopomus gauderio]|uniref:nuclear GTPase SLIP-GC-like isoform X1 n=1 Tax=Brachyhypopomus gauderio TaxID=698409 RepID=UPI0040413811
MQSGSPMERVAVDVLRPFPVTESGNRYVLVAMDYFTKWPEAYEVPDQSAITTAETLLHEFFCRFGIPEVLHSDQGRNFESDVMTEVCRLLGVHRTRTTPFHPQGDGLVERFNRTLTTQLAMATQENQRDWDKQLPLVLLACRSALQETTGFTPAMLMFGRELQSPVDLAFGAPPTDDANVEPGPVFVSRLRTRLLDVHVRARVGRGPFGHYKRRRIPQEQVDTLNMDKRGNKRACEDNNPSIRDKISNLNKDIKNKITIGVFGSTGHGKSSLINAVLGHEFLLPSGSGSACTSVIIQVEANEKESNYIAEIEFIPEEDWEREFKSFQTVYSEPDLDKEELQEKITALYGVEASSESFEHLKQKERTFKIGAMVKKKKIEIKCKSAKELSSKIVNYVRQKNENPGKCYWPIVKIVTIKVPNCKDFLEHVVLVDLPGTGDCNRTRDEMWKTMLHKCSSLWIVSDINRADSDKSAWEMLSNCIKHVAQGGECSSISFICTKTDTIDPEEYIFNELEDDNCLNIPEDSQPADEIIKCIRHRNDKSKKSVKENFDLQTTIKESFRCGEGFFSVFTVSAKEFTKANPTMDKELTEIPALRNVLKTHNTKKTKDLEKCYISAAFGIISLIQSFIGAAMMEWKSTLQEMLIKNLQDAVENLCDYFDQVHDQLETRLSNGEIESEEKCEETAENEIKPNRDGRGFHRTLTSLCKNEGSCRSKNRKFDLNECLATHMYEHIDKKFSDFFPVEEAAVTEDSVLKNIDDFTIISNDVNENNGNISQKHMVDFFRMQEKNLKARIKLDVVDQKKKIYESLSESIKTTMKPSYEKAAAESGTGSMKRKQDILLSHISSSKSEMFQKARQEMLKLVKMMRNTVVEEMERTLKEDCSLLSENTLLHMNVREELEELRSMEEVN